MKKNKKEIYNNENPLFFLFTCVKDGREYINKLFDSLLSQTKINFVHYIYEDGSEDPIDDLVEEYKKKVAKLERPFKVIYEKNPVNIGLNMATKHCIDQCYLPYFIWIDCDNWVDINFFKNLEKRSVKNKNIALIKTNTFVFYEHSNKLVFVKNSYINHVVDAYRFFITRKYVYSIFAVNSLIYKDFLSKNEFCEDRYFYNDEQVLTYLYLNKCNISFSKKSFGYVSMRFNSESDSKEKRKLYENGLYAYNYRNKIAKMNLHTLNFWDCLVKIHSFYLEFAKLPKIKKKNEARRLFKTIKLIANKIELPLYEIFGRKKAIFYLLLFLF